MTMKAAEGLTSWHGPRGVRWLQPEPGLEWDEERNTSER